MITYNDIYEALRKEKYSDQLQVLGKKFIGDFADYLEDKKKLALQEGELFSDEVAKIKKQLENSRSIFDELMLLRKKKILGLVFVASETGISKKDFENMFDFEKELFDKLMENVKEAEKKLSLKFVVEKSDPENEMSLLLFLDRVDEFVGLDGETLGPFEKDEISNIPKKIADILIGDGKAEIVSGE
jgi:DNA replication initiation complex subunit (GINS family)